MTHEPPATPRRLRLEWWLLTLLLAACAWAWWRDYDYRSAVREARGTGFSWWQSPKPFDLIRNDWHAAFRKATWTERGRELVSADFPDLARFRSLLHRLRPTLLAAHKCKDPDLDALNGLNDLRRLVLSGCPALQNVDGLKDLSELQSLGVSDCPALQNVDGLKGLSGLRSLALTNCPALQNVNCLKALAGLQGLNLSGCHAIPVPALRELRAALPQTYIVFPDGSNAPP